MKNFIKNRVKIVFLLVLLSSSMLFGAPFILGNNVKDYDKIFEKISQTRVGIKASKIDKIKNPFVVIYKNNKDSNKTKKPNKIYSLNAIFNNRAMINRKWYKIYSKVGIYKLTKIKKNSVLLRSRYTSKELFIRKKNESKIKFSSK